MCQIQNSIVRLRNKSSTADSPLRISSLATAAVTAAVAAAIAASVAAAVAATIAASLATAIAAALASAIHASGASHRLLKLGVTASGPWVLQHARGVASSWVLKLLVATASARVLQKTWGVAGSWVLKLLVSTTGAWVLKQARNVACSGLPERLEISTGSRVLQQARHVPSSGVLKLCEIATGSRVLKVIIASSVGCAGLWWLGVDADNWNFPRHDGGVWLALRSLLVFLNGLVLSHRDLNLVRDNILDWNVNRLRDRLNHVAHFGHHLVVCVWNRFRDGVIDDLVPVTRAWDLDGSVGGNGLHTILAVFFGSRAGRRGAGRDESHFVSGDNTIVVRIFPDEDSLGRERTAGTTRGRYSALSGANSA